VRGRANAGSSNRWYSFNRRRPHHGRSDWTEPQSQGDKGRSRSVANVDIGQVERLRTALVGQNESRWERWAVVGGAALLGLCVVSTLVLSARIDARANRIVRANEEAAKSGAETVARLEGKLDGGINVVEDNSRKIDQLTGRVDVLTEALATTTTVARAPVRRPVPPTTAAPPVPTVPPRTIPPTPQTTTTTRPCRFLLILPC
jgi:hypothetical protein